jgi:hypothetical protein
MKLSVRSTNNERVGVQTPGDEKAMLIELKAKDFLVSFKNMNIIKDF